MNSNVISEIPIQRVLYKFEPLIVLDCWFKNVGIEKSTASKLLFDLKAIEPSMQ